MTAACRSGEAVLSWLTDLAAIPLLQVDEVSLRSHPSGAFDGIAVGSPSLLHQEDVADQAASTGR